MGLMDRLKALRTPTNGDVKIAANVDYHALASGMRQNASDTTNFDFKPTLITNQAYSANNGTFEEWMKRDGLTRYIVKFVPEQALNDGFDLVDPDDETRVHPRWNAWKTRLESIHYFKDFIKAYTKHRFYQLAVMLYTNKNRYQVISGDNLSNLRLDEFDEPKLVDILVQKQTPPTELEWIKDISCEKFDVSMYDDTPYILPIFDKLVMIYWITYSMTEAAAREGAKLTVVWTNESNSELASHVTSKMTGASSRSLIVLSKEAFDSVEEVDMKLSATFTLYLTALYEQVAIYTGIPQTNLVGAQAGAVEGSEVNDRDMYDVFAKIQKDAEKYHRQALTKLFGPITNWAFKWEKSFKQSEKEIEEVKAIQAQRMQLEVGKPWKVINEVREELGLDPMEGGDELLDPNELMNSMNNFGEDDKDENPKGDNGDSGGD